MAHLLKKIKKIKKIWELPYSRQSMTWVSTKLSFALLRATNLCICGTRYKWKRMCMEDGSGINPTIIN